MATETYHLTITIPESEFLDLRRELSRRAEDLSIYTDRSFVDQEEMAVEDHSDDLAELVPPGR